MLAFSHPGKFGDIIYSFPAARWLCNHFGQHGHFYISSYYGALKRLIDFQSWMDCVIPEEYEITHHGWGAQPWDMSPFIDMEKYEHLFQFGFRQYPAGQVHKFYLESCGFDANPSPVGVLEGPDVDAPADEYIVLAPRGDMDFFDSFISFMDRCPIKTVQIGAPPEYFQHENSIDCTGIDWLETLGILAKANGFMGLISSQGGLAHNFDFPKAFLAHKGWGASIGQLPLTPTTGLNIMETGGVMADIDGILQFMGLL